MAKFKEFLQKIKQPLGTLFSSKRTNLAILVWAISVVLFVFICLALRFPGKQTILWVVLYIDITLGTIAFLFFVMYFLIRQAIFRRLVLAVFILCVFSAVILAYLYNQRKEHMSAQTIQQETQSVPPQVASQQPEAVNEPIVSAQIKDKQEEIIKCKAKLYNVTATKEQCDMVVILDNRAQSKLNELDKEFDKYSKATKKKTDACDSAFPSVYQIAELTKCYRKVEDDANDFTKKQKKEREKINKDLVAVTKN